MRQLVAIFTLVFLVLPGMAAESISLAGKWRVQLAEPAEQPTWDTGREGLPVVLPGTLRGNGLGWDVAMDTPWMGGTGRGGFESDPRYAPYRQPRNIKVPFWLQPVKYYRGKAWYRREVAIPDGWRDKRIVLRLERPHWETTAWVDGERVGSADSLSTPHVYDVTAQMTPGRHTLTIGVNNQMVVNVGPNSHSVTDHTQGNWNGLVGDLSLEATGKVWIEDLQAYPDLEGQQVRVVVSVGNATGAPTGGKVRIWAEGPEGRRTEDVYLSCTLQPPHESLETTLNLGPKVLSWDEFEPNLYRLCASLDGGESRRVVFGMREVGRQGTQITINGRPTFLRGTLECCIFPLTSHPPTDVDYWRKIVRTCKAHGLNHIRFHSWCPPEAAFVAADELGFYYQVECASWANSGASIGNGGLLDTWLYEEGKRITRAYANHPSFLMMAYGNEPAGPGRGAKFLGPWCTYWKEHEPRCLHTSGAGWPAIAESDYHNVPQPRIQGWGQGLRSIVNAHPPQTEFDYAGFVSSHPDKPTVSHEIGQWCVYPDLDEIPKYTGVLKARNFEVFRDFLDGAHMGDQARAFLMASGKLQTLCYKAEIEAALRTKGIGGFQLLDLHDFPGQGTALVGVLDPFWDSKPYVTPREYSRFCGPTVPLARLAKRTFTLGESIPFTVDVAHYGSEDMANATVWWQLKDEQGGIVDASGWNPVAIPAGTLTRVGAAQARMKGATQAGRYRLTVGVPGLNVENEWDVWGYPESVPPEPDGVLVVKNLDAGAGARLRKGGKVLLLVPPGRVKTDVKLGFSSVFWNTAWTGGQPPHTLGILCDPSHPSLASFPTDYHSNWQWWELVTQAATMEMDGLPEALRPIVQVVPDWFRPKRLGLVFEAKVDGGKLVVCSIDLENNLGERPVARQLRHSLLSYMASDDFQPLHSVRADDLLALFEGPSRMERLGVNATADSEQPGYEAVRAIDGDSGTMWHTAWEPEPAGFPHELVLQLAEPARLKGIRLLPRQDGNANGLVKELEVYVASTRSWGRPVARASLKSGGSWQTVSFERAAEGRFVRLRMVSPRNPAHPWASMAEVDLIEEGE